MSVSSSKPEIYPVPENPERVDSTATLPVVVPDSASKRTPETVRAADAAARTDSSEERIVRMAIGPEQCSHLGKGQTLV